MRWLECTCPRKGVALMIRKRDFEPIDGVTPVMAEDFCGLDGEPISPHSDPTCETCGALLCGDVFMQASVRVGNRPPPEVWKMREEREAS